MNTSTINSTDAMFTTAGPTSTERPFPTLPQYLDYALAFFLFVAFIVGVAGNGAAVWIFLRTKSLRTAPNILIINLSISDVGMVLSNFPLMFASTVHGQWISTQLGCEIYAFFGSVFGIGSISTMTAIALDRHYVICHSMEAMRTVTKRKSIYKILIVWLYSLLWSIMPFFGFGAYVLEGYGVNCTFDYLDQSLKNRIYVGLLFMFAFFVPLCIIIGCYSHIAYTLRVHRKQLMKVQNNIKGGGNDTTQNSASRKVSNDKIEWQIAKVGIMLTVLFCTSWLPYATVAFIGEFIDSSKVTPLVQVIPVVLAKSSASWNPLVYAISHKRFKEALRDRFLKYCCGSISGDLGAKYSSSKGTRGSNSRASTRTHSVISQQPGRDQRSTVIMTTALTSANEMKDQQQPQQLKSSIKRSRDRPEATRQPPPAAAAADAGNVRLFTPADVTKTHEAYVHDNQAEIPDEKEELTKL